MAQFCKVLYRGLDLMLPAGLHAERMLLVRLWYVRATGQEPDDDHLRGIHGLRGFVRAIQTTQGGNALEVVGAPTRNREEIYDAIAWHRDVAARVGRELAARCGFDYPEALERMVRREWDAFRRETTPPF